MTKIFEVFRPVFFFFLLCSNMTSCVFFSHNCQEKEGEIERTKADEGMTVGSNNLFLEHFTILQWNCKQMKKYDMPYLINNSFAIIDKLV